MELLRDRGRRTAGRRPPADGRVPARDLVPGPGPARRPASRSRSPSRTASPSRSTATSCAGRTGRCGSASTTARASSSTARLPDGDELRPIAHRISFAEMVVPYRDPSPDHHRRTAYDIGEWGLGFMTTSLELGCDCLGEITYVDAVLHDSRGRAVHDHERHLHARGGRRRAVEARRREGRAPRSAASRRLVVSFHATVANYEYLIYWRFYQDGTIECEVRATGIMVTELVRRRARRRRAPSWTTRPTRRSTSTSSSPASTWRSTGRRTPSWSESEALPISDANPYGLALVQRSRAAGDRVRGQAGLRLGDPARLEGRQPRPR